MDIQIGYKRDYITYGTVVALMLDYSNSNVIADIPDNPGNLEERMNQTNNNKFLDYLTSKEFLFTHGVFNEYCILHKFKNFQHLRDSYLNTAFIILPAFEFESMDNLNKLIKKAQKTGIGSEPLNEINEKQIYDSYIKFKQEIQTNHDKCLELMKKENNRVNYYDCFQLMHLKSGSFLEYKRNNKNLKTYIQLTTNMSKRTLFRFIPSFEYQMENSTNVFFFLSVQIASGQKRNNKEKYMSGKNSESSRNDLDNAIMQRSFLDSIGVGEDDKKEEIDINNNKEIELEIIQEKSRFDGENLKNILKEIYQEDNQDNSLVDINNENQDNDKIIDEFVKYSINENLMQKNFGSDLMPEDNYVIMDYDKNSFWRLINLSEDYFEDIKYLNLFDYFCIQSTDKNLFINVEIEENEEQNYILLGDNIDNQKIDLKPIKEEYEKEDIKSEIKNDPNIINNNINKNHLQVNFNENYIKSKNINNSMPSYLDNQVELEYYFESNINSNRQYNLLVESYNDKEHLKPYSLFRFEPVNEEFEEGEYGFGSLAKFSVLRNETDIRIFNTFTNKVLYAEKIGKNKYKLILIDDVGKNDKRYRNTIFQIMQLDSEEMESEEIENVNERSSDNEKEDENSSESNEKKEEIKKNTFIKIRSKKYLAFLGIRTKNEKNSGELILTNSIADITRFKLNCLDEEDKHEVNFFEQLLLGFNNILNYFRKENRTVNLNWKNYEKIAHILKKFKNKLDLFQKDDKGDNGQLNLQENKFDFLEILKHFNIVSKLIEIFLTNWFQNYQLYTYNQLEEKLKKIFQEDNDVLKYKLMISKIILEILTKIYTLKQSYLNIIEDSLLYFLMFVGRDDRCTTFLIHILTDNAFLLVSLCPLYKDNLEMNHENIEIEESLGELNNLSLTQTLDNEEINRRRKKYKKLKYYNIKKCLERIINDYNSKGLEKLRSNFYSVIIFFLFLSTLLVVNNEPFKRFYEDYFQNLGLLKKSEDDDNILVPNYEKNPILIYFYLNNGDIYAKSIPFYNKDDNINTEGGYNYKLTDLIDIFSNYNLETEEKRNQIFFSKLVHVSLIFYSYLSVCDIKFKNYLYNIFKLEHITKNFLNFNYNIINNSIEINNIKPSIKTECPLLNDIKCSILQLLTFLYLKKRRPYTAKTHLFKFINGKSSEEIMEINISDLDIIIKFIKEIFESKQDKFDMNKIENFALIQFIELIKYVLRNLYIKKNNREESNRNKIYYLISQVIKVLEKHLGISLTEGKKEEKSNLEYYKILNEVKDSKESMDNIINDKLDLKDPMLLVSENFEYFYIKIKNKLEKIIKKPCEKIKDVIFFLNILNDICDTNVIQKTRYDMELAKTAKKNKNLLKKFDLKSVLMSMSLDINKNGILFFDKTLYTIEEIILEFLQYLEYSTMEEVGDNIKQNEKITREAYLEKINSQILSKPNSSKYLDEFISKIYKNNNNILSICFFKFLEVIENEKLRQLALEILFYLNSSKNLFYYNVNNLVIMDDEIQYTKFLDLKNLFVILFDEIKALNLSPRLDKNTLVVFKLLSDNINELLNKLFDDDYWTNQNNLLNKEEDYIFEDPKGLPGSIDYGDDSSFSLENKEEKIIEEESDNEDENIIKEKNSKEENTKKEESKQLLSEIDIKTIKTVEERPLSETKPIIDIIKRSNGEYFMNEFDEKNLKIFQQTLYNLGFIDFIVGFFTYIDKLVELKSDFEGEFKKIETSIISIYKILVAFIHNNNNTQSLIKYRVYLFICPLKLKNISTELLYSINYFIFHLVHNFKTKIDYAKISKIGSVIDNLYLLHQINWNKHKNIMPYYFKTLLMFFKFATPEYIFPIFELLNDIKNVVVEDIMNGNCNNNCILILAKLLDFHENELKNKEKEENKFRPLLCVSNIIKIIPKLLKFLIPHQNKNLNKFICSRPLILIINIIIDYYNPYYKDDLEENKDEIYDSLLNFCEKIIIKNKYIYKERKENELNNIDNKKKKEKEKENINIKYFNIFMAISLPKIYLFLTFLGLPNSEVIINKLNQYYEKIKKSLTSEDDEVFFFKKNYIEDIVAIFDDLENDLPSLKAIFKRKQKVLENMEEESFSESEKDSENEVFHKTYTLYNMLPNEKDDEEEENDLHKSKYFKMANKEIEEERKNYITKLWYFFNFINKNNIQNNINNNKDVYFYINFCDSYIKTFGDYIIKSRIFFFYWTNIYLMNFKIKESNDENETEEIKGEFEDENPIYNKKYFNDLSLVQYTIECFEKMNLNINNYENFIYIKFLDNYLFKLDEENAAKFLLKIIEMPESRNLFHLLHNILDKLQHKIKCQIEQSNCFRIIFLDICPSSINEKKINDYILAIKFLTHLSENNNIIQNQMKDYLRIQYNNSKSHNFIIICSKILEEFAREDNLKFIPKNYDVIISLIEFLTKCCGGPCLGNQECIVKYTNILEFIKLILLKVKYRLIKFGFNGEEINNGNDIYYTVAPKNRRILSYLKFKLLLLLNNLTVGRKNGDKIFDSIHQIIGYDVLEAVLVETYKEILIETGYQKNYENLTYEDDLLSRMRDYKAYLNNPNQEKKFIIYENGTFSYLLINIYLQNLIRPIDVERHNNIQEIKQKLESEKCKIIPKSHFYSFINSFVKYNDNLKKIFKKILGTCGDCFKENKSDEDFKLKSPFKTAFSFYFEKTPHIEVSINKKIIKYYIKLSPICSCLTEEMKDEFHNDIDRASSKTKIANLFDQVEFFRSQLIMNKKILDAFSKAPVLNLIFNHYQFYRNIFLIIAVIINLLIFMSFYRTTDDIKEVTKNDYDLQFDYGFLYRKENIPATRKAFLVMTIIELVLAILILVNYFIFRVSYLIYFKKIKTEDEKSMDKRENQKISNNKDIFKNLMGRSGNFILNLLFDTKFLYHLFLLIMIIVTLAWDQRYKILSILLLDIIERSNTLMCIVKSFWEPKKQIIVTLLLFYLVAYYFIILVYLFIPNEVPKNDCMKFSDCFFTLSDQAIKNSNGIINYLLEEGLYIYDSLWRNPRFWIDNWFAIFDIMLVMQMFCGIIIDTYLSQREKVREIEKDKSNNCFICGLNKNDLNKYYSSEFGFNEHIKLDHYLWNYMFAVFNVTSADENNMIYLDRIIKKGYETNVYSSWVPYKKCFNQMIIESNQKEKNNEEGDKENNEEDEDD